MSGFLRATWTTNEREWTQMEMDRSKQTQWTQQNTKGQQQMIRSKQPETLKSQSNNGARVPQELNICYFLFVVRLVPTCKKVLHLGSHSNLCLSTVLIFWFLLWRVVTLAAFSWVRFKLLALCCPLPGLVLRCLSLSCLFGASYWNSRGFIESVDFTNQK